CPIGGEAGIGEETLHRYFCIQLHTFLKKKTSFKLNEKLETVKPSRLKRLLHSIDLSLTCQKLV
ncbi:MAG: hypothetical protein VXC58_14755, partial [Deltaproteobacteria bacterium]